MRNFSALQVGDALDLLAPPAAHLRAGVAARHGRRRCAWRRSSLSSSLPPPCVEPGVHLPGVEAERDRRCRPRRSGPCRSSSSEPVWAISTVPVPTASTAWQVPDDLAGREDLDLEVAVGRLGDVLGERLGGAVERVERFREARGQPPADLRRGLGDGRHRDRGRGGPDAGGLKELATLHWAFSHGVLVAGTYATFRRR